MRIFAGAVGVSSFLSLIALAWAAPGDLDPTFGNGGYVRISFGTTDAPSDGVLQPDGKIVVVGNANYSLFGAARFLADGTLDPTFGAGGKATVSFGAPQVQAWPFAVALQDDGKIVVVGRAGYHTDVVRSYDIAVARLLPDGSLDSAFGNGGKVRTGFDPASDGSNSSLDEGLDVALQPDGKIVVVGHTWEHAGPQGAVLVRYLPDGSLDPTFGAGGKVKSSGAGYLRALALQPDGKILAGGYGSGIDFSLARFANDGGLDTTFGTNGVARTSISSRRDEITALALQPDGKIVAAGFTETSGPNDNRWDFAVARYEANGVLDTGFGTAGTYVTDLGGINDKAYAVAVQEDGAILVGGKQDYAGGSLAARNGLVRYTRDGLPDTGFGTNGVVITTRSPNELITVLLVQPDGRVVAVACADCFYGRDDFAVLRYLAAADGCGNGVLDPGESCDAAAGCCAPTCQAKAAGRGCRAAAGECDPAEACDGTSSACPADARATAGTPCAPDAVICTVDVCDGSSVSCTHPAGNAGTVCRLAASGDPCDVAERCDGDAAACPADTGLPDGDADGECDAVDPCTNDGGAQTFSASPQSTVILARIDADGRPGDDKLKITASFALPPGKTFADLRPDTNGARVVIEGASGDRPIDAILQSGAYAPATRRGWKRAGNARTWTFVNNGATPLSGITKLVLTDRSRSATPRRVKVVVTGVKGTYPVEHDDSPVQAILTLGNGADAAAGVCGESTFAANDCAFNHTRTQLTCKN